MSSPKARCSCRQHGPCRKGDSRACVMVQYAGRSVVCLIKAEQELLSSNGIQPGRHRWCVGGPETWLAARWMGALGCVAVSAGCSRGSGTVMGAQGLHAPNNGRRPMHESVCLFKRACSSNLNAPHKRVRCHGTPGRTPHRLTRARLPPEASGALERPVTSDAAAQPARPTCRPRRRQRRSGCATGRGRGGCWASPESSCTGLRGRR